MEDMSIKSILVCGHGLAGQMTLSALANNLPDQVDIHYLNIDGLGDSDVLYGSTLRPTAYDFHLKMGLSEPELLQSTNASFSYGCAYIGWGDNSWVQCFHLPFPIWENVPFHHFVAQSGEDFQSYLVSGVAAKLGVFAHPPKDPKIPLSRAEYGYHFTPRDMTGVLTGKTLPANISIINDSIESIKHGKDGEISAIILTSGKTISADLYIDCSGPDAVLLSPLAPSDKFAEPMMAYASEIPTDTLGQPMSLTRCGDFGWQSDTPLRGSVTRLTIFHPDSRDGATKAHGREADETVTFSSGSRQKAWIKNCVGIGHSVSMLAPLTPAPMMLLQKDIERLLELIPVSDRMEVERREYNRRFCDDYENATLFDEAYFATEHLPVGAYWGAKTAEPRSEKLKRKLTQFESRGFLTNFDYEPFNEQDWIILHFGMGRRPKRYDLKIDRFDRQSISKRLTELRTACETIVAKMPPHDRYIKNYLKYLEKQNGA